MADEVGKAEARKHIKQLENQIIKFKHLIQSALYLSETDNSGLDTEKGSIKEAIENLEKEKLKLEDELNIAEEGSDIDQILQDVIDLESENVKLKAKFQEVVSEVEKENEEINQLKKENHELGKVLEDLENEKSSLMEKLKKLREQSNNLTCENVDSNEMLPSMENQSNAGNNMFVLSETQ